MNYQRAVGNSEKCIKTKTKYQCRIAGKRSCVNQFKLDKILCKLFFSSIWGVCTLSLKASPPPSLVALLDYCSRNRVVNSQVFFDSYFPILARQLRFFLSLPFCSPLFALTPVFGFNIIAEVLSSRLHQHPHPHRPHSCHPHSHSSPHLHQHLHLLPPST